MRELSHEKRKLSKRWVIHRLLFNQLSPINLAVVSHDAFIFSNELFIIKYGVEKK